MMIKRLLLSVLCVLTLSANAQAVSTTANEQLSDSYVRSAVSFMTFSQMIESDEPQILAATLLDAAIELNPANAQAWAMRAELAEAAGDQQAYEKALVGYLDTGIDDDRARFNLIRHRLSSNNTLDAQFRDIETLLNSDAGQALSGPLRARLAMFACSVAGELFDEKARRKWAVEAARADPANLEAAQTMLALVVDLGGDATRRSTATVNVIRADPLSPAPRLDLAAMLAEHGAFERAAQQYQVVSTRLTAQPLPLPAYINWAHCLAMTGQDALLLRLLEEFESALNQPTATEPAPGEAPAEQPAEQPAQARVDLPLSLALIRLAVLKDAEDQAQAKAAFDRILQQMQANEDDQAPPDEQAKQNLAWIAAVFGPDLDQAAQIAKDTGDDAIALGWIALRRGDKAAARDLLQPHIESQPLAACGHALATAQDNAGAARLLQSFIESDSPSSLAALAAGRAMLAIQTPAQPTTTGKAMLALMAKYPEAFWQVDLNRTPWMDVRLKIKPQRIKPLQPMQAEITIWNTSRFPLAITDQGPISRSAVITINATSAGRYLPPTPPIVVDLGQRFTIGAGERMIIDTRLDYHQFGSLRASNPDAVFSFDARLVINPTPTPAGTWTASGIGGVSEVRDCLIESSPATPQAIETWLTNLNATEVADKVEAIRRLANLSRQGQPGLLTADLLPRLNQAMLDAWDNASEMEQAWMVLNTIDLSTDNATYPAVLEKATASKSKRVWLALLISQATEADSDLLRTAIGRQDLPEVSRFAERQRKLLRDYAAFQAKQENQPPAE